MSTRQFVTDGVTEPLNADYWYEQANTIAAKGQRLLAFAARSVPHEHTVRG